MIKKEKKIPIKKLCVIGIIAALYSSLTLLLLPLSYGTVQLRLAEAMCILPCICAESVLGLSIGCLLANIYSSFGIIDTVFGTLITLTASLISRKIKNPFLTVLPPIILNAAFLPLVFYMAGGTTAYWLTCLSILISQSVVLYALGIPLYYATKKGDLLK